MIGVALSEMAGAHEAWLSLGEASHLLGVDPDTLRRWADDGKVGVFRTPGGHRRFPRASIAAMLPRPRSERPGPLSAMGEAPDHVAAEFRKRVRAEIADRDWAASFDEETRGWFRAHGVRLSRSLLGVLDAADREARLHFLAEATTLGRAYGTQVARAGLSLSEATEMFMFFRARFLAEIAHVARRHALEPAQTRRLFDRADHALDRVLLYLVVSHRTERAERAGRTAPEGHARRNIVPTSASGC